jgi:hypothetical protein
MDAGRELMDDLRFAVWFGLLCAAFALATFM